MSKVYGHNPQRVTSVNGGTGDIVINRRNYWSIKKQTLTCTTYDESTGIYTVKINDVNDRLWFKFQQFDKTGKPMESKYSEEMTGKTGICSITTVIKDGAASFRVANTIPVGYTVQEFSVYQNDASEFKAGDTVTVSFDLIDPTINNMKFKNLILTKGNTPIDWSPAPEDYLGPFNAYNITNMHRNIFRGKSLGSTFTDAQKAAIAAGTWDDLYLGDYWTINNHTWRIADFDYWLGKGYPSCTKHHIVVVPDVFLYVAQMHNTESSAYESGTTANTTEGGYFNSDMRTTNLDRAKTLIETDFGTGSILNHRILLTNAVKDGYPSAGTWCDSEVDLMNEMMVYGAYHFAPRGNGTILPYNHTTEYTQLALFQVVPYYIMPDRASYWLRDVVSETRFASVFYAGYSNCADASRVDGVRPAVGIVGS